MPRPRLTRTLPCLLGAALATTAGAASAAQNPPPTPLQATVVASGLSRPVWVGSPPNDDDRVFVLEQHTGRVRVIENGTLRSQPFLDLRSLIATGSERGLLGLAFHPSYTSNGWLYVNYTRASDGATMVVRYTRSASDPNAGDPGSALTVLGPIAQPYSNHNGGGIAFGRDGYLYVGLGDGGGAVDPNCNAQNRAAWLGKLLRIDVDTATPYAIPPSNPYANHPTFRPEVWAYGLRNPWRFSFDRQTGDLWIGDVGQNTREEVDFQPASSQGGENYGWKMMEGTFCPGYGGCPSGTPQCQDVAYTLPLVEYGPTVGNCVIGGHVYRGCAIPDLRGTYFYGDYNASRVWSLRYENGLVKDHVERTAELRGNLSSWGRITSFGEDARGEILFTDLTYGRVLRIDPAAPAPATDLGHAKAGAGGASPTFTACGLLTRGNQAALQLRNAPANTVAVLVLASQQNPRPFLGGTLVPTPLTGLVVLQTNAAGELELLLPGGLGQFSAVVQYVIADPGATFGASLSNALLITMQP